MKKLYNQLSWSISRSTLLHYCQKKYFFTYYTNFLKEIINPFSDNSVGATNGMAFINPSSIIGHFQAVEFYFNNLIRNSFSKVFNNGIWFFGAAACFRKSVLN